MKGEPRALLLAAGQRWGPQGGMCTFVSCGPLLGELGSPPSGVAYGWALVSQAGRQRRANGALDGSAAGCSILDGVQRLDRTGLMAQMLEAAGSGGSWKQLEAAGSSRKRRQLEAAATGGSRSGDGWREQERRRLEAATAGGSRRKLLTSSRACQPAGR